MPIYKVEAPDGKLLKIEGPEGASEQEILAIAAQLYQPEDIKPDTGFTGAFAAGKERLKGDIALLAGKTGLMSLEDAERYKREKDILAQQMFKPTEEGWSESPFLKFRETLGGSLPYMAAPLAAGVGAKVLALPAAVGLTGAGLASLSQFTGSNLARQIETGKTLEESSLGKAAAAAVPQTALDVISLRMIPSIGKLFGAAGKEVTPELAKEIAKQGMLRTTAAYGMGSAKLAGIEGATEVGQQFLERLQAGLNISDQQARDEYFDSFIGGAVLGGTLAVPGTYLERGATIRKGAEMEAEQKRQEIVERQKAQQEAALAERKRIQETQKKLGVPETLALPKPEDRYVEPEVADPLLNPLGNFKTTDLSAKEIREINQRRQAMGKPRIGRTFSIEDLADVFTPEETKTAEGVLGRLVASRTGFQAGDDISPSTLNLAAQQRGIATDTQGFRDFLERTTGTNNLDDMSPPQRLAVKQALDNIPVGSESQVLQAGITTVKHYTPDQYNETIGGINKEFAEVGNKPNGRESVLKQIEKYSGLTREKDQQRLLDEAVRNGDLERNIEVRTVGGVEKNVETFKPPTALKPLPAGMDIRKETFKQADVPEAFEIRAGSNVINQKATQEEAEAELAIHERNRQAEIVRLEKEIAKLQAGIQRREAELLNARSLGQDDTNEFFIKSANYYGQDQVANQEINNLRQEQQKFSQPIQIVPVGTKALTRDAFTFYEKDQPLVRFETEEQAEAYGISRLNDQTLKQIIESAPAQKQTGRVKRYVDLAQKELEARAGKAEGIKVTTKKGKEGATERLKELGIYTKEARDKLDDFKKTLLPTLKKFGLEKIGLRIVNSIEDGKADGYYVQNLITLALDAKDIMGTLRHESIHAIKELGGFTDAEWKVLTNKAKAEWVQRFITDRGLFKRYQDQYKQDYGSLKGFDEYIQEEAIAEAFRFYSKNKLPAGMIGNIIYRIQKFFEALRNSLNKLGFTTANDIFVKVEEGGIKTLEPIKAEAKPARLSFKSEKKEITPLDVQQARIYERELEGLIKKIGDRIVGMKSEETLADVKKAVKKLQSYTAQGLKGKDWYERSAKAVLDAFNNDAVLAEKFFQVIAITSANTEVAANFTKAANAWTQFAEGRPIKAGTENENKKIDALLNFGEEWEGRKTNTFYSNLMEAMDGKDSGRSTIDLHMTRMIFGKDVPTDAQYELAENMVRLLASKLDVAPRQIQAASWVTQKAKTMFDDYRAKGWKKDLSDEELSQFAFERAVADYSHQMKKRVSELPITEALKEPSKEIKTRVQTITGEVIPSVKSEMAEAEELAFNYKEKLTKEIANSDAVQRIAKFLGVDSKIRITVGSGAYASKVNPNLIVQIINDDAQAAEKDALDIANAMSYVFKQDATPFYRADPKLLDTEQIGFKIKFDTANLTPAQQKKILGIFQNKFGADAGFTKVRNNELVIINYRGEDGKPFLVPDEEFMQGLADIRDAIGKVSPIESQEMFGAKSEYPYHDWQEEPSGVGIVSGIQDRRPQRPDIQRGLDDIRESFVGSVRETIRKSGKEPKFSLRAEGVDQRFSLALGNIEPTTFLVSEKNPNNTGNLAFMPGSAPFAKYPIRLPVGTHDDISDKGYGANHILRRMQTDVKRRPAEVTKERLEDLILHIEDLGKRFKRIYRSGPNLVLYDPLTDDAMFVRPLADRYEVQSMYSDARIPTKYGNPAWSGKNVQPTEIKKFEEKQRGILVQASKEGRVEPKPIGVKVKRVLTPNQIEEEAERKPIKGTLSIKKKSLRAPDTKEFKQWFKDSKVVDEDGNPKVMYHGTRQEIFEPRTRGNRNAFFVSPDANFANKYAVNDLDWFPEKPFRTIEEGAQVYPVYISAKNPFDYENPKHLLKIIPQFRKVLKEEENYNRSQIEELVNEFRDGSWKAIEWANDYDLFKKNGFDAFYTLEQGRKNLGVFEPTQIKSAIGNNGTYSATSPDIRYSLKAPDTPEVTNFLNRLEGSSRITDEDGNPIIMYHGTARDITEFKPKQANAIFLTFDPDFAAGFAESSDQYVLKEIWRNLTLPQKKAAAKEAVKNALDQDLILKSTATRYLQPDFIDNPKLINLDTMDDVLRKYQAVGQNVIPVYVYANNPFDFRVDKHVDYVLNQLNLPNINEELKIKESLSRGDWSTIESKDVQEAIVDAGFDGFFVMEGGRLNLGVYDSSQIKSAFNVAPTAESKDIRYSFNAPPETHTKLEQANTYGKAITDTITSVYKMFKDPEERIKTRIAFIDPNSGLARSLKDQELYNDGVLRADLLARAKAQTINLIRNGLQTGVPVVNSDGSVIIEIDEVNNLANSRIIADRLDENYYVKGSGLSGRSFVAEVARALRGKEIMAEDKIHNAKTGEKRNREKQVTQAQIDWAEQQLKNVPELQEIFDIWKKVNTGLINLWESVGLFSKAEADTYRAKKFYVSLAASNTDLETMMESQLGFTAAGLKSTPKVQKLEGAEFLRDKNGKVVLDEEGNPIPLQRNIWENIDKQYASMLAGAYQNQVRKVAVGQLVDAEAAKVVKPNTVGVNLKYKDPTNPLADSKGVVHAIVDNATDLAAFESMHYELGPVLKFFGSATNILRAGALLNPMFWIRQLIRDPIHASIVANSGIVTPFHSAKEYINVLRKNSEEAKILASRGVIGQYDSTLDLYTFLEQVGTEKVNQGNLQKAFHKLMQMHEASDAATRVAIFKKEKQAALERGMTDEQATNFAVMKSREAINFLVHGNSKILNAARQMIPFLSASITSLDTVYRAATGYNLPASEREAARRLFKQRAALMFGASVAYAMLMQDDEEYQKQPNYVKDNNWLIKNPIGDGFLKVPVPYEVGFLFKVVPEVALRYAYGNDTGKEMIKAYKDGLLHNLPTGGVPVPQAIKPAFETITNYSFFTGNPVESIGESRLPVEMRGRNASETAKFLSGAGLGFVGLSPSKIDNLVQGYFAEAGTFMFTLADELVYALNGKQGAARNLEKQPFFKAFMTDPNADKAVSNFFDIQQTANRTAQGFNELKNSGRLDEARELVEDEEKRMLIASAPALRKVGETMTKIRRQIEIVKADESRTPEERRELINKLTAQYNIVARQGVRAADTLGIR